MLSFSPGKLFVVLAAAFGLLFVFLVPPFQVPDEPNHAFRIFQISQGGIAAARQNGDSGGNVPNSLLATRNDYVPMIADKGIRVMLADLRTSLGMPLEPDNSQFVSFPNTALYSPVPYLPAAGGFAIGKLLGQSPLALCWLGRICNLLAWLLLVALAVRATPVYKWLFTALALLPMSLFEAASLSADAVTNGLAFLTVALFFKCAFDHRQAVGRKEILALAVVTVLLSFSKNAYFLATGLFLLIPTAKLGSWRRQAAVFALLVGVNMLALAIWAQVGDTAANLRALETRLSSNPDADHVRQLQFILADFPGYLEMLGRTAIHQFRALSWQFIGVLGWLDAPLPKICVFGGFGLLVFCGIFESRPEVDLRTRDKGILGAYAIGTGVLVATMVYMGWSSVGATEVDGLQGRYFIPLAPAFFALLHHRSPRLASWSRTLPRIMAAGILLLLLAATATLVRRYYDCQSFSGTFKAAPASIMLDPAAPVKMAPATGFADLRPAANVSGCRLAGDGLAFAATGSDPQLLLPNYTCPAGTPMTITIEITAPAATRLQVFYTTRRSRVHSEPNSVCAELAAGRQAVALTLPAGIFGPFRLDPGKIPGDYVIHRLEIQAAKPPASTPGEESPAGARR
jgi:uncharacterized membrane protein